MTQLRRQSPRRGFWHLGQFLRRTWASRRPRAVGRTTFLFASITLSSYSSSQLLQRRRWQRRQRVLCRDDPVLVLVQRIVANREQDRVPDLEGVELEELADRGAEQEVVVRGEVLELVDGLGFRGGGRGRRGGGARRR